MPTRIEAGAWWVTETFGGGKKYKRVACPVCKRQVAAYRLNMHRLGKACRKKLRRLAEKNDGPPHPNPD